MAFKLKLKRGTAAPANTALDVAEPGYNTSAKKLYIGNGSGVEASGVSMDGHTHAASDITSGTLSLDRIPTITIAKGGTNITTYTTGDLLYASNTDLLSKLGIGSTGQILTVVGGVPAWAAAGVASSVANNLTLKVNNGSTEGTSLYTYNGSAAKTLDFVSGGGVTFTTGAGSLTIAHTDTSSQASVTANGRTYITGVTLDTYGHVTALTTGTETVVDTNTTYAISAETVTGGANLRLTGSDASTDDVKIASGTNVTVTRTDANTITIASTDTNNYITGFTYVAGTTAGPTATITREGLADISVGAIPSASGTASGIITTGSQTFAGSKTFSDNAVFTGDIAVNGGDITTSAATFNVGNTATTTQTINLGTAATASGATKTINIGTGSATGSTTDVYLGSTSGTSTVRIQGNLVVTGTSSSINAETVTVDDNIIVLNNNVTGTPTENAGIEIERGTSANVSVLWNESTDRWTFTNDGSTYYNMPISTEYNNYVHPNHTGDVTSVADGATTIVANAVTDAKFRQSAGLSVVGRSANTTGNVADITAATDGHVLRRSGTTLGFGLLVNANIDASAAIAVSKLAASTISGITLGNNLNSVTFNNGGTGDASGTAYNGSTARTISYNTVGAAAASHTHTLASSLTDVVITSPATDSLLQYNGTSWIDIQELDCGTYAS
jgi:hypothetical protein